MPKNNKRYILLLLDQSQLTVVDVRRHDPLTMCSLVLRVTWCRMSSADVVFSRVAGHLVSGEIGPFSTVRLEIVWQPTIPGKVDVDFAISFADAGSENVGSDVLTLPISHNSNTCTRTCSYMYIHVAFLLLFKFS